MSDEKPPFASITVPGDQSATQDVIARGSQLLDMLNDPTATKEQKEQARAAMHVWREHLSRLGGRFDVLDDSVQTDPTTGEVMGPRMKPQTGMKQAARGQKLRQSIIAGSP